MMSGDGARDYPSKPAGRHQRGVRQTGEPFFVGSRVEEFDRHAASGTITWRGQGLRQRISYHQLTLTFEDYKTWREVPRKSTKATGVFPSPSLLLPLERCVSSWP